MSILKSRCLAVSAQRELFRSMSPLIGKAIRVMAWMLTGLLSHHVCHAGPITYTETLSMTGMIGNTPFTDAAVTLTTIADTSTITFMTGSAPFYENAGITTIQIGGVATATFTTDTFGAFSQDLSSVLPGLGSVGIIDITQAYLIGSNSTTVPPFYDLSTSFTSTGTAGVIPDSVYSTTLGDLTVISTSGSATFTAAVVPEPATIVPAGLAFLILGRWSLARVYHARFDKNPVVA
jgi:hypothetical protein